MVMRCIERLCGFMSAWGEGARTEVHIHLAGVRPRSLIATVAVMPADRTTLGDTSSMWMRTGIRWARRTQVKMGLTVSNALTVGRAFATLIARARLSTWP